MLFLLLMSSSVKIRLLVSSISSVSRLAVTRSILAMFLPVLRVPPTGGTSDLGGEDKDRSKLDCGAMCGEASCDDEGEEEPGENRRVTPGGLLRLPPTRDVDGPEDEVEEDSKHSRRGTGGEADDTGEGGGEGELERSQRVPRPEALSMLSQATKMLCNGRWISLSRQNELLQGPMGKEKWVMGNV